MPTPIDTRRAGLGDIDAILTDVAAGFATYVDFAQPGWRAPDASAGWEAIDEEWNEWTDLLMSEYRLECGQPPSSQPSR